jgi:outer membrane usher protein
MARRRPFRCTSSKPARKPAARCTLFLAVCLAAAMGRAGAQEREAWYVAAHNHLDTGLKVLVVTLDDGSRWLRVSDLRLLGLSLPTTAPRLLGGDAFVPVGSLGVRTDIDAVGGRLHLLDEVPPAASTEDLVLDLVVNGEPFAEAQVARRNGNDVLLSRDTLALVRLGARSGDDWTSVRALAGEHYVLDESRMRLELTVAPEQFESTRLSANQRAPASHASTVRAPLSMIIGYDVGVGRAADGSDRSSLLLDTGVAADRASCRNRELWRSGTSWSRLDTACFVDWPERRLSLSIGDAISRDSSLSGSVRYGGVRIGTDFALQPELRTQPLLGVEGTARLPSTLEIWARQQLAFRGDLPPGPFEVSGLPAQSGRGQLDAIVTDALGRRVVVSEPYYSDPNLLQPGLSDWALELGKLREGFLTAEDHYTDAFGLLSWRGGLSSSWTMEARAEWETSHQLFGISNYLKLGHLGVAEISAARSLGTSGSGAAGALGYSYQGFHWNLGLRYAAYDAGYRDLAYSVAGTAPARDAQLNAGVRVGRASLSFGATLRDSRRDGELRLAHAGLSVPIGRGYLSVTAFRPLEPAGQTTYSAIFTLPLSGQRSASAWVNGDGGGLAPGASLQRSLPAGPGYGYRLLHEDSDFGPRTDVEASWRSNRALLSGAVLDTDEGTDYRLGAAGALVMTRDAAFLSTDDGGSFALVDMPQQDARLMREHQYAVSTRGDGKALLSGLRPFETNRLDIDSTSLDFSSHLDQTSLDVTPGRRQVVVADFGASHSLPLSLRVKDAAGAPMPAGALAHWSKQRSAQVGYDGILYLELDQGPEQLDLDWRDRHCTIPAASLPTSPDPAALYEVTCQ